VTRRKLLRLLISPMAFTGSGRYPKSTPFKQRNEEAAICGHPPERKNPAARSTELSQRGKNQKVSGRSFRKACTIKNEKKAVRGRHGENQQQFDVDVRYIDQEPCGRRTQSRSSKEKREGAAQTDIERQMGRGRDLEGTRSYLKSFTEAAKNGRPALT